MTHKRLLATLATWALLNAALPTHLAAQGRIVVFNGNGPGVGFNDPTPAAPVGGNAGTTLGQQRVFAFLRAAEILSAELDTNVDIEVLAAFIPLPCTTTAAVLGSAGTTNVFRDFGTNGLFPGAEFPGTWYPSALVDKRLGVDVLKLLGSTAQDIQALFNVNLGRTGCLPTRPFYLGLDGNEGNGIDLLAVLIHELSHGLGFQQFANSNGRFLGGSATAPGFPDVFNRLIFDNTQNKFWTEMTEAQRAASTINPRNVVFTGAETTAAVPAVLRGTPTLAIQSPASIAGNMLVGTATFGAPLTSAGVTGPIRVALDASDAAGALETDGCSPLTNAGEISGTIALVDRGGCGFVVKASNAQSAGAIGILVANNVAGPPAGMTGVDPSLTIPAAMVSLADGNTIKTALQTDIVIGLLGLDDSRRSGADSSNRALLYTPNPFEAGSSVSHFDTSATPNVLMEPFFNSDLSHNVKPPFDLTLPVLRDIGWFPDTDVDGLRNDLDACPNASDQRATIFVGPTDTGVENVVFTNGCSINDLITLTKEGAANQGAFVSGIAHLTQALVAGGFITEEEAELIRSRAARYR